MTSRHAAPSPRGGPTVMTSRNVHPRPALVPAPPPAFYPRPLWLHCSQASERREEGAMASEVPRLARQLFLRGLAVAFLAAFASLYVQLPGEPAAAAARKSGEGSALHMPRGALALPGCCAQSKSEVLAGASGRRGGGGGCVPLSDLAEGPAPKVRGLFGSFSLSGLPRQPLGRRHRLLRLAAPRASCAARPPLGPAAAVHVSRPRGGLGSGCPPLLRPGFGRGRGDVRVAWRGGEGSGALGPAGEKSGGERRSLGPLGNV